MDRTFSPVVHGSFAFDFRPEITLYRSSGSWNLECARIYDRFLRKRIASEPPTRRCMISDDRLWDYDTPEAGESIKETVRFLSEYYKDLHIAYIFRRDQRFLYKLIIESHISETEGRLKWKFFTGLPTAVGWLRSEGFEFPDVTEDDFPVPKSAEYYLESLGEGVG